MSFTVSLTDPAEAEVDTIVVWMTGRSPERGKRWYEGFRRAVDSLEEMPTRCPVAAETEYFGVTVRQLRYLDHRIPFRILDSDGDGTDDSVEVLHVLHLSRGPLYPLVDD
jgi:plasmid stabilization system protein ParE